MFTYVVVDCVLYVMLYNNAQLQIDRNLSGEIDFTEFAEFL